MQSKSNRKRNITFELIIKPKSVIEIEEAVDQCESQQPILWKVFYNYLDGYFKTLKEPPTSFAIKLRPTYRKLIFKRFPHVIIYKHTEPKTFVYSIFNSYQYPSKTS